MLMDLMDAGHATLLTLFELGYFCSLCFQTGVPSQQGKLEVKSEGVSWGDKAYK